MENIPTDIFQYLSENFLDLDEEGRLAQVNKLLNSIKRSKKYILMKALNENDIDKLKEMKDFLNQIDKSELIKFIENKDNIQSETIRFINLTLNNRLSRREKEKLFQIYLQR
jgi:hypothetical protein